MYNSSCGNPWAMPSSKASPASAPAVAPPPPNNAAPINPNASTGPTPGTRIVAAAAPTVAPAATPIAPPTVPPNARPMPGCSASIAGSVASNLASEVPGARILMCLSETPSERRIATPRFASVKELNTPTTVVMLTDLPQTLMFLLLQPEPQDTAKNSQVRERQSTCKVVARFRP